MLHPAPELVIAGKYRLVRRLGAGGMATVWLAKHLSLDVDVAIKLMAHGLDDTPQARARFEREAKASALLRSAHITRVTDYGIEGGVPFMVQELLVGEDLGARFAREGRLALPELVRICGQVCKGLEVAHDSGIVHRDIKPGNLFLAAEGRDVVAKILDFGVARETSTKLVEDHTSSGTMVGSPHHMSPEQAMAERVDGRSDLWSLAVVLYRGITGKRPFQEENLTALMLAIATKPFPPATRDRPELPADIDRFFERALHRSPDRRYATALEFAAAFAAATEGKLASLATSATKEDEPTMPERSAPRLGPPQEQQRMDAAPTSSFDEPTEGTLDRPVATGVTGPTVRRKSGRVAAWAFVVALAASGIFLATRSWRAQPPIPDAAPVMAAMASPSAVEGAAGESSSTAKPTVTTEVPPLVTPQPVESAAPARSSTIATLRAAKPNRTASPASPPVPTAAPATGPGKRDPFSGIPLDP